MTALDKAAIDLIKSMLNQHTNDLKTEFNEQVKTLNKNSTENTEQIKKSIAGLAQNVAQNTESITNVSNRVDNIENEFKNIHSRMAQLEQGPSTAQEHLLHIAKTNTINQEIQKN